MSADAGASSRTPPARSWTLRVIGGLISVAAFMGCVFWAAGRLDWWRGWIYLALLLVIQGSAGLIVWRRDPELIRRRGQAGEGTPRWDMVLLGLFGIAYMGAVIVAALDAGRIGNSATPAWTWLAGALMHILGVAIMTWAMVVNTHFEKTVRIQHDRGHRVIDRGPYAIIRHPGYVGASLAFPLAVPLLLGSWWALLPALLSVAVLVIRTALEDRFLERELDGYAAYASRVRYRLFPGFW